MRALLVAIILFAGCHKPSYSTGARSLGASFKKLGKQVVAIAPVKVDAKIDVDASTVVALAKDQAAQRVGTIEPITINKSIHRTSTSSDGGADLAPAPAPEPVVVRHDASAGSDQVWKNLYRDGEKATCEKAATFDQCSAECGEHMRAQSMKQLAPGAGKPQLCECTQGYSKCQ